MAHVKHDRDGRCRGCSIPISFYVGPKGNTIPLQRVRTVYVLGEDMLGAPDLQRSTITDGSEPVFVSHFETCPNADQFTKKKG